MGAAATQDGRPTTTTPFSSLNPSAVSEPVNFTAVVSGQGGVPTGTLSFDVNGNASSAVALTGGKATFSWTFNDMGSANVTANYSRDGTYAASTSAAFTQTIDPVMVTISGSPQDPLTQDASGDYLAVVTITNTGNVAISSLQVSIAGTTLRSGSPLSMPAAVTNLAVGASATLMLTFPPDSVQAAQQPQSLVLAAHIQARSDH